MGDLEEDDANDPFADGRSDSDDRAEAIFGVRDLQSDEDSSELDGYISDVSE